MADPADHNRPIWAPWRIEYILAPKTDACFLCDKALSPADDVANRVVFRGDLSYVLLNTYPYNPGHLLVAPYRHLDDLEALSAEEQAELFRLIVQSKKVLRETMAPEGFNIGCNLGGAAGAGLKDHLHWHVVPRWAGDTNFMPVIGAVRCVPEALDATCTRLRENWR